MLTKQSNLKNKEEVSEMLTKQNKIMKATIILIGINLFLLAVFFFLPNYSGTGDGGTLPFVWTYGAIFAGVTMLFGKEWLLCWTGLLCNLAVLAFIGLSINWLAENAEKAINAKLFVFYLVLEIITGTYLIIMGIFPYVEGVVVTWATNKVYYYIHFLIIAIVMAIIAVAQAVCWGIAYGQTKKNIKKEKIRDEEIKR